MNRCSTLLMSAAAASAVPAATGERMTDVAHSTSWTSYTVPEIV